MIILTTILTYAILPKNRITKPKTPLHRRGVIIGVHAKKGTTTFYDNSPEWIRESIDGTLQRLGTDYLDLFQIHYRDGKTPLSVVVDTLEELKKQGKIRYYGLSNIHESDFDEITEFKGKFVSFQNEYSLACRKNEQDIKTLSKELNMTPMTWGSLGQGILTGKYDKNTTFKEDDRRSRDIYVNLNYSRHRLVIAPTQGKY